MKKLEWITTLHMQMVNIENYIIKLMLPNMDIFALHILV